MSINKQREERAALAHRLSGRKLPEDWRADIGIPMLKEESEEVVAWIEAHVCRDKACAGYGCEKEHDTEAADKILAKLCTCPSTVWASDGSDMNESTCEVNHDGESVSSTPSPNVLA